MEGGHDTQHNEVRMQTDIGGLVRRLPALATVGVLLAVPAACGDDEDGGGDQATTAAPPTATQNTAAPTVQATTPVGQRGGSRALVQLTATAAALDRTVAFYSAGDKQRALDEASTAYVDHFEQVEPALERADEGLNEDLEKRISTGLRDLLNRGAPAGQVQAHVATTKVGMRRAFTALGGRGRPPF